MPPPKLTKAQKEVTFRKKIRPTKYGIVFQAADASLKEYDEVMVNRMTPQQKKDYELKKKKEE